MSRTTRRTTRPRGLAPWNPQECTLSLLVAVLAVLTEYADYLPLTLRQIYYRLIGQNVIEKSKPSQDRLQGMLVRARRAGRIPFEAMRDDGIVVSEPDGWAGPEEFWAVTRSAAEGYQRNLLEGQTRAVELWVEAAGMVPQVASGGPPLRRARDLLRRLRLAHRQV